MRNNNRFGPCCRFVEVVERIPKCPCDCVPPIPSGPPCPFKPTLNEPVAIALQSMLQQSQQESDCPLVAMSPEKNTDSSQLCVFSQPGPINFKALPPFNCTCVPGTCPELAKNIIRSLGYDPMCKCPCPQTVEPVQPEPETKKKHKRKKRERTKSNPDSKTNLSESSADTAPSSMEGRSTTGKQAGVSLPRATSTSVVSGTATSPGGVQTAPGGLPTAAGDTTKPPTVNPMESKHSGYSGSSIGSLLVEGRGFKIFEIDGEKVLFNYSTKNCPLLKCKCSRQNEDSCGCSEWVRLTKYRNCRCPGARKFKPCPPVMVAKGNP